jgi:hypothetical protein
MFSQLEVSDQRFRVRTLPVALRRRFRLGRRALAAAVVLLVAGLWVSELRLPLAIGAFIATAVGSWGLIPVLQLRRRHPWALALDAEGIRTASGVPPRLAETWLPWTDCSDIVVASPRTARGVPVVFVGFLARDHDPNTLPVHHVTVRPDRRGLRMIDRLISWLRHHRPDIRVTVAESASEIGVHRLGL